jgi:hypothetical protein
MIFTAPLCTQGGAAVIVLAALSNAFNLVHDGSNNTLQFIAPAAAWVGSFWIARAASSTLPGGAL